MSVVRFVFIVGCLGILWLWLQTEPYRGHAADAGWPSQQQTVAAIDWLRDAGLDVRGHVLVWPGASYLPRDIRETAISETPGEEAQQYVRNRIAAHIASVTSATANKLYAWDVVNEPRENHLLMDYLPERYDAMNEWFRLSQQAAPEAKLFLNENGILDGGRTDTSNQEALEGHLRILLDAKAPVDGVGLQAHFDGVGSQAYFTRAGSVTPLVAHIRPVFSLLAPGQSGAALRNSSANF